MKKLLVTLACAMLCMIMCISVFAAEAVEIKMTIGENVGYVNGVANELDAAPIIRGNRTMLPVRFVAENLGAAVEWDGATSTATVKTDDVEIKIVIGKTSATVNGEAVALDAPAFIENNRTYMPVRFVAENLGATVEWDGATSTATITLGGFVPFHDDYETVYTKGFDFFGEDLTKYVTLGQYKGFSVKVSLPPEVSDDEVENYIAEIMNETPEIKQITDRGAQYGDNIVVNFVGKIDGVAFDGGTAENYEITLGNGGFIAGFEEGMVGMKVGETKNVETVFPENYQNTSLAGKKAIFEITMLSIYEEVPAELTDAYVQNNFGIATVKEFTDIVREELEAERNEEAAYVMATEALRAAKENATVHSLPVGLVNDTMYQQIASVKQTAAQYGMSYDTLLMYNGYTVEDYETYLRNVAEDAVAEQLIAMQIAKQENILPSDTAINAHLIELIAPYGFFDADSFCAASGMDKDYLYFIAKASSTTAATERFLLENNTFAE